MPIAPPQSKRVSPPSRIWLHRQIFIDDRHVSLRFSGCRACGYHSNWKADSSFRTTCINYWECETPINLKKDVQVLLSISIIFCHHEKILVENFDGPACYGRKSWHFDQKASSEWRNFDQLEISAEIFFSGHKREYFKAFSLVYSTVTNEN